MKSVFTGTEVARPFVPAKDFEVSRRFYLQVGFSLLLDGEVAIFAIGQTSFILQNHFNKDWAENFMMQLMVDDVDAWWDHLNTLNLPGTYPTTSLRRPEVQPWGLKVSYLVDPSGVLWHIAQRRAGMAHDS